MEIAEELSPKGKVSRADHYPEKSGQVGGGTYHRTLNAKSKVFVSLMNIERMTPEHALEPWIINACRMNRIKGSARWTGVAP
jgi:hypothetical protein